MFHWSTQSALHNMPLSPIHKSKFFYLSALYLRFTHSHSYSNCHGLAVLTGRPARCVRVCGVFCSPSFSLFPRYVCLCWRSCSRKFRIPNDHSIQKCSCCGGSHTCCSSAAAGGSWLRASYLTVWLDRWVYLISTAVDLLLKNLALEMDCLANSLCLSSLGIRSRVCFHRSRVTDCMGVCHFTVHGHKHCVGILKKITLPGHVYILPVVFHCK